MIPLGTLTLDDLELADRTVLTTAAHVEIIADRYGVGVSEVDGYYYAVVVKPGQDHATVWCAPVDNGVLA